LKKLKYLHAEDVKQEINNFLENFAQKTGAENEK